MQTPAQELSLQSKTVYFNTSECKRPADQYIRKLSFLSLQRTKGEGIPCIEDLPEDIELILLSIPNDKTYLYEHSSDLNKLFEHLPSILVGDYNDKEFNAMMIELGLQDIVSERIFTHTDQFQQLIELCQLRHQRELYWQRFSHKDNLTGLDSRAVFLDRLQQAILHTRRHKGIVATLLIDIDNFRNINETLGHEYGDALLKEVVVRVHNCLRVTDTLARIGGDEFAIIVDPGKDIYGSIKVSENIKKSFEAPFIINDREVFITISIGIAASVNGESEANAIFKEAEIALHKAKAGGHNNTQYFTPELAAGAKLRLLIQSNLHRALKNQEFFLCYQPQWDSLGKNIIGFESLLRWQHPELGTVAPDVFVPLLEETGLIVEVSDWIINEACKQHSQWLKQGLIEDSSIAINISARQFGDSSLIKTVQKAIAKYAIPPEKLDLELTETYLMSDMNITLQRLNELKALGVQLSIDDFGTGYSSLGYLKKFPIDAIKIDRSFVENIPNDQDDVTIIQAIVGLSHNLGYKLVAEGVETREQLAFLQALGCESYQGYYFSRPLSVEAAEQLLKQTVKQP